MNSLRHQNKFSKNKKNKNTNIIIFLLLFIGISVFLLSKISSRIVNKDLSLHKEIEISDGKWLTEFYKNIGNFDAISFKMYLKDNQINLDDIKAWTYSFSGNYTKTQIVELFKSWPNASELSLRLLEWWNIYNFDQALSYKNYINTWDYIAFVQNPEIISKYKKKYEFLGEAWNITTLEWFLYPDTYIVDKSKDIIDQLVYLQLENFNIRVRQKYKEELLSFANKLKDNGYKELSFYETIKLASIIEKEEWNPQNKPIIAWIFLNRLKAWRRLDADVSLCYGLKMSYLDCTKSVIAEHIRDTDNKYNTRKVKGITPTPIWNPTADTISWLVNFAKTEYMFYLHNKDWIIEPSVTNQEHSEKKDEYLWN